MNKMNKKETIKTIQRKRVAVSKDVMCECLNKTVRQYTGINKVSEDVAKNPTIMTNLDEMIKYISAENTAYAKGKKFEYLNMSALLNNSLNSNFITMTKGSHDYGVDAILESKNQTVFVQMKYRSKAKLNLLDAFAITGQMARAMRYYTGSQEAIFDLSSMNTDTYRFVLVTNARITKNAMETLAHHHWEVINNDTICDYMTNPSKYIDYQHNAIK